MHCTAICILLTLAFYTASAFDPAPTSGECSNLGFTFRALAPGTPIHLKNVHANGQNFWIGKGTAAYCPRSFGAICDRMESRGATSVQCIYQTGHETSCSMRSVVPGGQLMFVNASGELAYTSASHSMWMPASPYLDYFQYRCVEPSDGISSFTHSQSGFTACAKVGREQLGPWKVFARVPGLEAFGCINFIALPAGTNVTVWQYQGHVPMEDSDQIA